MRLKSLLFTALLIRLNMQSCTGQENNNTGNLNKVNAGAAVIELFTSEGCSSCPAADNLMPRLKEIYK